eukprot:NODE_345_length_9042_cov_0.258973.p8 type:complete len:128 gc:universal NODE_345_length_9042_cov_0.258973:1793-1410(-)
MFHSMIGQHMEETGKLMIKSIRIMDKQKLFTKEITVHLHKHLLGTTFKKRAPKAIKTMKKLATQMCQTDIVKIEPQLNHALWRNGIKQLPHRIRVRVQKKMEEDKVIAVVGFVPCASFKGKQVETIE